ncbi:hypothetical protein B0H13DRAFT_2372556 [Mycena leptocephala]|nr:hypothetical protein B0H13DRAFT_2372556 [Mycena leptocephala]
MTMAIKMTIRTSIALCAGRDFCLRDPFVSQFPLLLHPSLSLARVPLPGARRREDMSRDADEGSDAYSISLLPPLPLTPTAPPCSFVRVFPWLLTAHDCSFGPVFSLHARARPTSCSALGEGKTCPGMRTKPRNRPSSPAHGGFAGKNTAGADAKDRQSCSSTGRRWRLGARPAPSVSFSFGTPRTGRVAGGGAGVREEACRAGAGARWRSAQEIAPCLSSLSCAPGTGTVATAGGAWLQGTRVMARGARLRIRILTRRRSLTPLDRRLSSLIAVGFVPAHRRLSDALDARATLSCSGECIDPTLSCGAECIDPAVAVAPPPEIRLSQRLGRRARPGVRCEYGKCGPWMKEGWMKAGAEWTPRSKSVRAAFVNLRVHSLDGPLWRRKRRTRGVVEMEMALVLAPPSESVFPPSCAFFDVHQLDGQVPRSLPRRSAEHGRRWDCREYRLKMLDYARTRGAPDSHPPALGVTFVPAPLDAREVSPAVIRARGTVSRGRSLVWLLAPFSRCHGQASGASISRGLASIFPLTSVTAFPIPLHWHHLRGARFSASTPPASLPDSGARVSRGRWR